MSNYRFVERANRELKPFQLVLVLNQVILSFERIAYDDLRVDYIISILLMVTVY